MRSGFLSVVQFQDVTRTINTEGFIPVIPKSQRGHFFTVYRRKIITFSNH